MPFRGGLAAADCWFFYVVRAARPFGIARAAAYRRAARGRAAVSYQRLLDAPTLLARADEVIE
jgi:hypothetical protein